MLLTGTILNQVRKATKTKGQKMKYQVVVIEDETGEKDNIGDPNVSLRMAEKVEMGLSINLDHDNFSTKIEEVED